MRTGHMKPISNLLLFPFIRPRIFTAFIAFCILINSFYPRAIIELKNYDVIVLAMGSQSVFLHLFALPNKVSVELANLIFNDKTQPVQNRSRHGSRSKKTSDSSSDFSILRFLDEKQNLKEFQLDICQAGVFIAQVSAGFSSACSRASGTVRVQGILYLVFIMLLFSRPRGDVTKNAINLIFNNMKPGLNLRPGFLFPEALS